MKQNFFLMKQNFFLMKQNFFMAKGKIVVEAEGKHCSRRSNRESAKLEKYIIAVKKIYKTNHFCISRCILCK